MSDFYVPDERDVRFASTGSNFNLRRIVFPDLEQISEDFEIEHFAKVSLKNI